MTTAGIFIFFSKKAIELLGGNFLNIPSSLAFLTNPTPVPPTADNAPNPCINNRFPALFSLSTCTKYLNSCVFPGPLPIPYATLLNSNIESMLLKFILLKSKSLKQGKVHPPSSPVLKPHDEVGLVLF
jgi:hypothetical protein